MHRTVRCAMTIHIKTLLITASLIMTILLTHNMGDITYNDFTCNDYTFNT